MAEQRFHFCKLLVVKSIQLVLLAAGFALVQTPQVLLAEGIPQRWEAKQYKPPSGIGSPRRVDGAGTRSPLSNCPVEGKPLTALVPSSGFGVTVAAYPTFFVYMPSPTADKSILPVEFILQDADGNQIYQTRFETSGRAGIITIDLPSQVGLPPLEIGQDYYWSFSAICQANERAKDQVVEGWVRRVALDPNLERQLKASSPQQQVELYAEGEMWHDALATLTQLRRDFPNNVEVAAQWERLLQAVGLSDIDGEPLVPSPPIPREQLSSVQ
ncbi:MAG TPA: hypothetical protein DDZ80_09710 [Cyanobacteria bacterium UBA8803]|nr:hypothetical protein [Cyanobacteria bacterium UBA9273]HBL58771.1 hypothetical protein [Cyanobacteria bacterium UBA8803]